MTVFVVVLEGDMDVKIAPLQVLLDRFKFADHLFLELVHPLLVILGFVGDVELVLHEEYTLGVGLEGVDDHFAENGYDRIEEKYLVLFGEDPGDDAVEDHEDFFIDVSKRELDRLSLLDPLGNDFSVCKIIHR